VERNSVAAEVNACSLQGASGKPDHRQVKPATPCKARVMRIASGDYRKRPPEAVLTLEG
jgi:hypothetical protein